MINDSLALAEHWLDAYRGKSLDIVDLYEDGATILCGCNGLSLAGLLAIEAYWIERFREHPALELADIKPTDGSAVIVSYRTSTGIVKAVLGLGTASSTSSFKIAWQRCGPEGVIRSLAARVR